MLPNGTMNSIKIYYDKPNDLQWANNVPNLSGSTANPMALANYASEQIFFLLPIIYNDVSSHLKTTPIQLLVVPPTVTRVICILMITQN